MSIKIELNDGAAGLFRSMVVKRCAELKEQILFLTDELKANEELLKQLSSEAFPDIARPHTIYGGKNIVTEEKPIIAEYSKNWTWEAKIKYVINEADRALTTAEIVKRIMEIEPYLRDRSKIVASVSATLSIKVRIGVFISTGLDERNETLFDLPGRIVNALL